MKGKRLEAIILSGTMLGTLISGNSMAVYATPNIVLDDMEVGESDAEEIEFGGLEIDETDTDRTDANDENLAERYSVCLEGMNADGSPFAEVAFALVEDSSGLTLSASYGDDSSTPTEMELLRVADGDIYINLSSAKEISDLIPLPLDQLPTSGWIKLPGLDLSEISEALEEMPDSYDWDEALELLYDQMISEDYMNDTITLQFDSGVLQIAAMLLDQMQTRYIQPIVDMDLDEIAGEYGKMIKEEASVLDNVAGSELREALSGTDEVSLVGLMQNAESKAFSEQYLKMKVISALNEMRTNQAKTDSFSSKVCSQYLSALYSALDGRTNSYNTTWKQLLAEATRRGGAPSLSFTVQEDGSFEGSIDYHGRIELKGKDTEDSFRMEIMEADDDQTSGRSLATVSAAMTDTGFDMEVSIDDMITLMELRPIYSDWGVEGISFLLKRCDTRNDSFLTRSVLSGECKLTEKGYEITVDALCLNGKYILVYPITLDIEFVAEENRSGVILSVGKIDGVYGGWSTPGPIRLSLLKEEAVSEKKELPNAIDGLELIRFAFREEMSRLQNEIEKNKSEADISEK